MIWIFVATLFFGWAKQAGYLTVVLAWLGTTGLTRTACKAGVYAVFAQLLLTAVFGTMQPPGPWMEHPGFTAHRAVGLLTAAYVCYVGCKAWLYPDAELFDASASALSRLQQVHPVGEHLAQVMFGLSVIWDIPFSLYIEALRTRAHAPLVIVHRVLLALLAYLALLPRFQCHAIIVFAVTEAPSVPFAIVELFHAREWALLAKKHAAVGAFLQAARVVFAITYVATRVVYFPYLVATGVAPDVLELLALPEPPASMLRTVLGAAVALTGVHLYGVVRMVRHEARAIPMAHGKRD